MIELLEKLAELDPEFCKVERDRLGIRLITLRDDFGRRTWTSDEIRAHSDRFNQSVQLASLHRLVNLGLVVCIAPLGGDWLVRASCVTDGEAAWKTESTEADLAIALLNTLTDWAKYQATIGEGEDA